jgi:hypothetical protein
MFEAQNLRRIVGSAIVVDIFFFSDHRGVLSGVELKWLVILCSAISIAPAKEQCKLA